MNSIKPIFIIIIIIILYYCFVYSNNESMTNELPDIQQQFIDSLYNYINNNDNINFIDYINFLTSLKNTNLNIIDNDVFTEFKILKKRKLFSKQDIITQMKLK